MDIKYFTVSIHAPVMDANVVITGDAVTEDSFNPRARDGREVLPQPKCDYNPRFNPRARDGRECALR